MRKTTLNERGAESGRRRGEQTGGEIEKNLARRGTNLQIRECFSLQKGEIGLTNKEGEGPSG